MAIFRATMIFKATSDDNRTAGWTESWYKDGTAKDILAQLANMCQWRAGFLAATAMVGGQRVTALAGGSVSSVIQYPGRSRLTNDIPQMAVDCVVSDATATKKKNFNMRGIPDEAVAGGAFRPGAGILPSIQTFFANLANGAWQWRARDTSLPKISIATIDALGAFTLTAPLDFAAGDFLNLVRVKSVTGKSLKGNYYVATKVNAQQGTFLHWPGDLVAMSGAMRKVAYVFPVVAQGTGEVKRIMVRKVGRPFDQYRGRATAKR